MYKVIWVFGLIMGCMRCLWVCVWSVYAVCVRCLCCVWGVNAVCVRCLGGVCEVFMAVCKVIMWCVCVCGWGVFMQYVRCLICDQSWLVISPSSQSWISGFFKRFSLTWINNKILLEKVSDQNSKNIETKITEQNHNNYYITQIIILK